MQYFQRAEATSLTLHSIDPDSNNFTNNVGISQIQLADALWARGRLQESLAKQLEAVEFLRNTVAGGDFFIGNYVGFSMSGAVRQAEFGDYNASIRIASLDPSLGKTLRVLEPQGGFSTTTATVLPKIAAAAIAYTKGDIETSYRLAMLNLKELRAVKAKDATQQFTKGLWEHSNALRLGRSAYLTGRYAEAEDALRFASKTRIAQSDVGPFDTREIGGIVTWLTMTLARQGKTDEALKIAAPFVTKLRAIAAKNHVDVWVPLELASLLYAQAMVDPKQRNALLREAAALVDGLPASVSTLAETRRWRERIQQARNGA